MCEVSIRLRFTASNSAPRSSVDSHLNELDKLNLEIFHINFAGGSLSRSSAIELLGQKLGGQISIISTESSKRTTPALSRTVSTVVASGN